MNSQETKQYLESLMNFEKDLNAVSNHDFKLERVSRLLACLNNPQKNYKIVHVAGTKGKGSVCAMTAEILKEAGYTTGLYTSPHVYTYHERIRVLSSRNTSFSEGIFPDAILDEHLAECLTDIQPAIEQIKQEVGRLTFYEVFTALALYYYAQQKCDVVVLETGLGGRLDATNACDSDVCAITPIALEHTHILGDTLSKIATEKSGIIKSSRQKVVLSPQREEALQVLKNRCAQFKIDPIFISEFDRPDFEVALAGEHQKTNAAVSIAIIQFLNEGGLAISQDAVRDGLRNVRWPIRFEKITDNPTVILDAAHTLESMESFVKTFQDVYSSQKAICIFGASSDKNIRGMLEQLNTIADCVILTRANHPRSASFNIEDIKKFLGNTECLYIEKPKEAFSLAQQKIVGNKSIVVAGSVFLASEIRGFLCTSLKV